MHKGATCSKPTRTQFHTPIIGLFLVNIRRFSFFEQPVRLSN